MQTIKGLIALLLVSLVVFTAVVTYNSRTVPVYEVKIIKANRAETMSIAKRFATKRMGAAVAIQKSKNSKL